MKAIKEIKGGGGFHGIANSQGIEWQEQRRFALQNLRNLGFGKSSMEDGITDEIHELCSNIRSKIDPICFRRESFETHGHEIRINR